MKNSLIIIFSIFVLGCKSEVLKKTGIVEIYRDIEIGNVPEHIIDMEIWDSKLLLGGYYWKSSDKKAKIYAHDINGEGIYSWQIFSETYESIYRIWVRDNAILNISTEQPPMHLAREKELGWGLEQEFNNFGWAVLGDTLSNGQSVRGYSTERRQSPGSVEIFKDGKYVHLGNPVKGIDGANRIVWCMEYFKGKYFAGTSWAENGGYKNRNCGNIYKLVENNWIPVYGHEVGNPCGGIVSSLTGDDRIFFGTFKPQKILIFDGFQWSEFAIDDEGEVSKIWKDNQGNIFAGGYTSDSVLIFQWNLREKTFQLIYTISIQESYYQWGVVGVCPDNKSMFIKYRDKNSTTIRKLYYKVQ